MILTIKTDQPEAELGLYDADKLVELVKWEAGRQLAETIHAKIDELLKTHQLSLTDLTGLVCFKGPGSFTGLRIGLTVGNALAYGLNIPIVGTAGENWAQAGLERLAAHDNDTQVVPDYGAPVHITPPRK